MTNKLETTPHEKNAAIDAKNSPCLRLSENENGALAVAVSPDIYSYIGTDDPFFAAGLINQIINAGTPGKSTDGEGANFMISVIKGIEPKDQIEAMLASQMAAVQMATMTFARRLAHTETISQQDSALQGFTKLMRCFTAQVEALKKYRSKGQKVTVEHVTVNKGGQAIVGSVEGGRDERKK